MSLYSIIDAELRKIPQDADAPRAVRSIIEELTERIAEAAYIAEHGGAERYGEIFNAASEITERAAVLAAYARLEITR